MPMPVAQALPIAAAGMSGFMLDAAGVADCLAGECKLVKADTNPRRGQAQSKTMQMAAVQLGNTRRISKHHKQHWTRKGPLAIRGVAGSAGCGRRGG
jgi:hypothetical protein